MNRQTLGRPFRIAAVLAAGLLSAGAIMTTIGQVVLPTGATITPA
jgi:hypothetical protein